ncbi:MAG: hypothetical protein BWX90_01147 [bacterium ADurb.Bin132]|nr:MAG: hypothetical protein BWX90_01147 [bacterium ADurb.Bin132]
MMVFSPIFAYKIPCSQSFFSTCMQKQSGFGSCLHGHSTGTIFVSFNTLMDTVSLMAIFDQMPHTLMHFSGTR